MIFLQSHIKKKSCMSYWATIQLNLDFLIDALETLKVTHNRSYLQVFSTPTRNINVTEQFINDSPLLGLMMIHVFADI